MMHWTRAGAFAGLCLLVMAGRSDLESVSAAAARCSLVIQPGYHAETESVLLARGTPDTIETGPGAVAPSGQHGHAGSGRAGPVFGQRFVVERFASPDSATLARAFSGTGDSSVVIVPWDYDAGCAPTRWTRSSAWVQPAEQGAFVVRLRPESIWTDGRPVFDAFAAAHEPYPLSPIWRGGDRTAERYRAAPAMTASQYFDFTAAMPTRELLWDDPHAAWQQFLRWRDANPELAQMYPANQAADRLASDVRHRKYVLSYARIVPVIGGTWRMSVSLDGGAWREFHLRTYPRSTGAWRPQASMPSDPLDDPTVPDAYEVYAVGSGTLETLRSGCRTEPVPTREGYMYVIDPPRTSGESAREWRGWVDPRLISAQFDGDSALAAFLRAASTERRARSQQDSDYYTPARYWLDPDGTMRLEQAITIANGRSLVLRGQRISNLTIACPRGF